MVTHTQTIRQQKPTHCLSVFELSVGFPLKGFKKQLLQKLKIYSTVLSNKGSTKNEFKDFKIKFQFKDVVLLS